jgi:hypothetical protein
MCNKVIASLEAVLTESPTAIILSGTEPRNRPASRKSASTGIMGIARVYRPGLWVARAEKYEVARPWLQLRFGKERSWPTYLLTRANRRIHISTKSSAPSPQNGQA